MFEITAAGEYVFGFFPVRPEGALCIFGATVEIAPEHDFRMVGVDIGFFARLTPHYQATGEKTFTAVLQNAGKTENESGIIKVFCNNNEVAHKNFTFSSLGETTAVDLNPVFESVNLGQLKINFFATISESINKETELLKIVSDSTFAHDNIDTDFFDGIGFYVPGGGMGNIFELTRTDVLTSITIGFYECPDAANEDIEIAVYSVNNNYELGSIIFEQRFARGAGDNTKGTVFDLPDTELQPGKYFFEVRQLGEPNMSIAFDDEIDGHVWIYIPDRNVWYADSDYGYIHVRPNFSLNAVGISSKNAVPNQLTLYPNPVKDVLQIDTGEFRINRIEILDLTGRIVQQHRISRSQINVSALSQGIYFLKLETDKGIVTKKFVKE
jgi:hypothetical protein